DIKVPPTKSYILLSHVGFGLPLSERPKSSDLAPPHRVRTKRCACNNQLDSECHYFCHLDIIWVNTPSKTTVYGLGSPLSRRRRSAGRCVFGVKTMAKTPSHTTTADRQILKKQIQAPRDTQRLIALIVPHWETNRGHFSLRDT
uniref:Endothelin-like toxin domain-containing protein n=1 Tax=Hucho hucho TaxID=62062 RepID=A0A4W5JTJ3_9TELE